MHHVSLLIGYGAAAVNPYLAMRTVEDLVIAGGNQQLRDLGVSAATRNLVKALGKGVLKVMSKMGISTVASYTGAQVFEALGLSQQLVDTYFTGTASRSGRRRVGRTRAGRWSSVTPARIRRSRHRPSTVTPGHRRGVSVASRR